jgi:hypothetical protein
VVGILIHSDCIVNTKTYNKSEYFGQVCFEKTGYVSEKGVTALLMSFFVVP